MGCAAHVWDRASRRNHPCQNKAKYGPYCGVHAPEKVAERRAKRGPTQFERDIRASRERHQHLEGLEAEVKRLREALTEALPYIPNLGNRALAKDVRFGMQDRCRKALEAK